MKPVSPLVFLHAIKSSGLPDSGKDSVSQHLHYLINSCLGNRRTVNYLAGVVFPNSKPKSQRAQFLRLIKQINTTYVNKHEIVHCKVTDEISFKSIERTEVKKIGNFTFRVKAKPTSTV